MKWLLVALLPTLWISGCHQASTYPQINLPLDTTLFYSPQKIGSITDPALVEISGLAPSFRNPGYLWAEEDSGNPNQIQLIKPDGTIAGQFMLPALVNQDWEDIATLAAVGTRLPSVYLAEIGDNAAGSANKWLHRIFNWTATKVIYRFTEPTLAGKKLPVSESIRAVETITLALPDGPRDAEAILADPVTNDLYVLSKGAVCDVYRAAYPQSVTSPVALQRLLTLPFRQVTAAAISPDGGEILIRTYWQLFYYKRQAGKSIVETLRQPPRRVPLASENQGEAIGWRLDGSGYYSTTERGRGNTQPVYFYARKQKTTLPGQPEALGR